VSILDDKGRCAELDRSDMLGLLARFPEQCEHGYALAESLDISSQTPPTSIVIAGMGGSGIGGDILSVAFRDDLAVPVDVCRGYRLPGYVSGGTLVICVSYSGNTEETLSAFADAHQRRAHIICVCSGGELARRAAEGSYAVITIPGGQPPRSATGYLLMPQIAVLERLGLITGQARNVRQTVELLKRQRGELGPDSPTGSNLAKEVASGLHGKVPIIYGSTPWGGIVAYRWKTQINENAKVHAFANAQSELSHNEILAWEGCSAQKIGAAVVNIRDPGESPKIGKRVEVTGRLIGDHAPVVDVFGEGETTLQRALTATYVGDFASVYLGLLYGTDPTPIPGIDILKTELGKVPD
jgi:glucose/mannose-6-phosphate isomerase